MLSPCRWRKANRIETMKGPAESGEICSVEVEKIAKKIAKNKRCYANTCAKFGGGSVTSNRDSSLTTRRSIHSAIHEPGSSPNKNSSGKISGFAAAAVMPFFGQR